MTVQSTNKLLGAKKLAWTVIMMDSNNYKEYMLTMLQDSDIYTNILSDPVSKFQNQLYNIAQEGLQLNILTQKEVDYIVVDNPQTPILHGLPKVHKGKTPPPMRPIISGIDSFSEHLSEWLDSYLQIMVKTVPGYLQDSKDLLANFDNFVWNQDLSWVSYDIESLYTSIPHKVAMASLQFHLNKFTIFSQDLKEYIMSVTNFLMTHNYFCFDKEFYIQTRGVSMGAKYSPSLANLTMAYWEEIYLYSNENPFVKQIIWYGRYIDDLLLVWGGDIPAIQEFADYLNNNPFNLRFVLSAHGQEISFLDLNLKGIHGQPVISSTFRKPTAGNTILHYNSSHPKHTLKAIPVGELTRAKRNCTDPAQYEIEETQICSRLSTRGYPSWVLNQAKNIVSKKNRKDLLSRSITKTNTSENTFIVLEYSDQYQSIRNIINKYIPILYEDEITEQILRKGYKIVSRKPISLGNILSPSLFISDPPQHTWLRYQGFFKCGGQRCKTCQYTKVENHFSNNDCSVSYPIKQMINCNTTFVVYMMICEICNLKYIGSTIRKVKTRFLEHVNNIQNPAFRNVSNIAKHFIETHNSETCSLKIIGIERIKNPPRGGDREAILRDREAYWILTLNTSAPQGLNLRRETMLHY